MALYTLEQWNKQTAKSRAQVTAITEMLELYHGRANAHGMSYADRHRWINTALTLIIQRCTAFLQNNRENAAAESVLLLKLSANRRRRLLGVYKDSMRERKEAHGAVQTFAKTTNFAVARAQGASGYYEPPKLHFSATRQPRDDRLQIDLATLDQVKENYWLERADPLHRPWGHVGVPIFKQWFDSADPRDFFTWVDENRDYLLEHHAKDDDALCAILTMNRGVKYVEKEERWRYRIRSIGGVLNQRVHKPMTNEQRKKAKLEQYSTQNDQTVYMGKGWAIWVMSLAHEHSGNVSKFYAHKHVKDKFHHSSFLSGGDVRAAGEWVVAKGKLLFLTNKTGHYHASYDHILAAIDRLHAEGVDLSDTLYLHRDFETPNQITCYWAYEMVHGKRVSAFPYSSDAQKDRDKLLASLKKYAEQREPWEGRRAALRKKYPEVSKGKGVPPAERPEDL
jgi:hypothetical protein